MSTKKVSKKRSSKKAHRKYDNSARAKKSDSSRQKIIEAYVDLLVVHNGQDVTLQLLAKKTKISMRTLFRFFGDKESLNKEIEVYLTQYLGSIAGELDKLNIADYAAYSYGVFDKYEKLFKAYLYTEFGRLSRRVLKRKFHELLVNKIISSIPADQKSKMDIKGELLNRIRFVANLISAHIWNDMHENHDLSGQDVAPIARWAVQTLLKDLNITL